MHQIAMSEFLHGEFTAKPDSYYAPAREYHFVCESFDRAVCTGPIGRDGIMPATSFELIRINMFAANARRRIQEKYGIDAQTFSAINTEYNQRGLDIHDLDKIFGYGRLEKEAP